MLISNLLMPALENATKKSNKQKSLKKRFKNENLAEAD
jgi:hypothetical protein